jgi:hypothetical protein
VHNSKPQALFEALSHRETQTSVVPNRPTVLNINPEMKFNPKNQEIHHPEIVTLLFYNTHLFLFSKISLKPFSTLSFRTKIQVLKVRVKEI